MSFDPDPGFQIDLGAERLEFTALESSGPASQFVYASAGKEGVIYRVKNGGMYKALKVFYPTFQDRRLLENTQRIGQYRGIEGLQVAERTIINRNSFPSLIRRYPELDFSILMPWVEGTLWTNLMNDGSALNSGDYLHIAQSFLKVVCNLESRGLAHCDLSNQNFIIGPKNNSIELIDIEDMYAPDMPRPIPDVSYGTPGYRNRWIAENGLWGSESDRFASAILTAEIMTWVFAEIKENRAGADSFFDEEEMGENSERYLLMVDCLGRYDRQLQKLFQKSWFSSKPDQCPTISAWKNIVDNISISGVARKQAGDVLHGLPPKMDLSNSTLDFGLVTNQSASTEFVIYNTGGSALIGSIHPIAWLNVAPPQFSINTGGQVKVTAVLKPNFPRPRGGEEFRAPYVIQIETNVGNEVLGGSFRMPKKPWYTHWWGLFGLMLIICGFCMFGLNIVSGTKLLTSAIFPTATIPLLVLPTLTPTLVPTVDFSATQNSISLQATRSVYIAALQSLQTCASNITFLGDPNYSIAACDTFDSNLNNWPLNSGSNADYGTEQQTISNGKYHWELKALKGTIYRVAYSELLLRDFELTSAVQRLDGSVQSTCYGLSFREGSDGYYWWEVCDDQQYSVSAISPQSTVPSIIINWTKSKLINPSEENKLTVIAKGGHFDLYINNSNAGSFDDNRFDSGHVGMGVELNAGDSSIIEFDYVAVKRP